jgi:hypothetical protein
MQSLLLGSTPLHYDRERKAKRQDEYEQNIRQEYPHIYKPLLRVETPDHHFASTLTVDDLQDMLDHQILKMLETGHLRPGYYNGNGSTGYKEMEDYYDNPGDTLLTLVWHTHMFQIRLNQIWRNI